MRHSKDPVEVILAGPATMGETYDLCMQWIKEEFADVGLEEQYISYTKLVGDSKKSVGVNLREYIMSEEKGHIDYVFLNNTGGFANAADE
jgi:hypothetical protein